MSQQIAGNRLDTMLASHPLPSWRPLAWPIMGFVLFAVIWANFSQLDEVSVAMGEVIPQGKIKVIQHLEGGIIEEIFVTEGDWVTKGQTLMQLDLASSGTNKAELQVRLDSQLLIRARLIAQAPAMLEALEELLSMIGSGEMYDEETPYAMKPIIEKAIKAAKGE